MKANLYKFSIVLKKCNYRDSAHYINNILTALLTYSNIVAFVGHVHRPTFKRPPYCVHKYFMPNTEILGGLLTFCTVICGLLRYYISHLANFLMLRITANNDKQ